MQNITSPENCILQLKQLREQVATSICTGDESRL